MYAFPGTPDGTFWKSWQTSITNANQDTVEDHHTQSVTFVAFSKDGQFVASGSRDWRVKIWNTSTGKCTTTFYGHREIIDGVSFSPDSTICASWGYNSIIRLWHVDNGRSISTLDVGDNCNVRRICFSPDNSLVVSMGPPMAGIMCPGLVELWKVATGERLAAMEVDYDLNHHGLSFDGVRVILRSHDQIHQWKLSSAPTRINPDTSNPSSPPMIFICIQDTLPMIFVPVQDTEPFILQDVPPEHQYHVKEGIRWVLDKQERRVLWIPDIPSASDSYGKKVAIGYTTGRVTIVNFSDAERG